jgi:hypothetical protein
MTLPQCSLHLSSNKSHFWYDSHEVTMAASQKTSWLIKQMAVRQQLCCSCPCRWSETMSLNCGHQLAYCSSPSWYMSIESHGGMILTGENQRTWRKTCPSATLAFTNPTWTDPGTDLGLSSEWSVTNRLSLGTATACPFKRSISLQCCVCQAFPEAPSGMSTRSSPCLTTASIVLSKWISLTTK